MFLDIAVFDFKGQGSVCSDLISLFVMNSLLLKYVWWCCELNTSVHKFFLPLCAVFLVKKIPFKYATHIPFCIVWSRHSCGRPRFFLAFFFVNPSSLICSVKIKTFIHSVLWCLCHLCIVNRLFVFWSCMCENNGLFGLVCLKQLILQGSLKRTQVPRKYSVGVHQ